MSGNDMPAYRSSADDLVLHGARVLGFASPARIAARNGLRVDDVEDVLLDFGALGWVGHTSFGGSSGWFVTDAGRIEDERRMAAELESADAGTSSLKPISGSCR